MKRLSILLLVAVMAIVTVLLRALPFLLFRKQTPKYISYLGRVLPPAIIGMLVISHRMKKLTQRKKAADSVNAHHGEYAEIVDMSAYDSDENNELETR